MIDVATRVAIASENFRAKTVERGVWMRHEVDSVSRTGGHSIRSSDPITI
jgi:hypothetical protein